MSAQIAGGFDHWVENIFPQVTALSNPPSLAGLTGGAELVVGEPAAKPASSDEI
jgi:hypothetical protein